MALTMGSTLLFAANSVVQHIGNQFFVDVQGTFNDPFDGPKAISLVGYDNNGVPAGWYCPNAYVDITGTVYGPQTVSVSPGIGSSAPGALQTFTVTVQDPNGQYTMPHMEFMLGSYPTWVQGFNIPVNQRCKVGAEISANLMWLEDAINLNEKSPPGNVNPGYPNPIGNSLCTFYPSMSSITCPDAYTAVLTVTISFQAALAGALQDHIFVLDDTGSQHWDGDSPNDPRWSFSTAAAPLNLLSLSVMPSSRNHTPLGGCGVNNIPFFYNDGVAVTYTLSECSGNIDMTKFNYCTVSGLGNSALASNFQPRSIDIQFTTNVGAPSGPQSVTCVSYYYWGYIQGQVNVLDSNSSVTSQIQESGLAGVIISSQNGDGSESLSMSADDFSSLFGATQEYFQSSCGCADTAGLLNIWNTAIAQGATSLYIRGAMATITAIQQLQFIYNTRTPVKGQPNSVVTFPSPGGASKGQTVRIYGPDGRAEYDIDYGDQVHPPSNLPEKHTWTWDSSGKPTRSPGSPVAPGDIPDGYPTTWP